MSSTTKALEHVVLAYNLPRGRAVDRDKVAEVAEAAEVAAEAPQPAQPAQAAAGGLMVCRELAATVSIDSTLSAAVLN